MKIEYNILWVEDEKSWYETTRDLFSDSLDDLGFKLVSKKCENLDQVKEEFNINGLKEYDLLLVDYTLKNTESGDKIIEFIRNIKDQPILTDVLFYSSAVENVRESMHKLGLEGVYTADRRDIASKFDLVVNTTIKKVQDLNNIRGLIMAETSDIDKKMFEIINSIILKNAFGIKDNLTKLIFSNVENKVNGKKDDFEKYFGNQNINRVLKDNVMFDAHEKLKAIQYIFDSCDHTIAELYKNDMFKTNYSEISKKRNLLGHETQTLTDGKIIIGQGDSAFEFSDEFCVDIRKKVRKHGENLDEFLKAINSM